MEDFKIQKVLGEGSFGKVYQATHNETLCKVAIKTLEKKRIMQDGLKERIAAQIGILKVLKHQNIAELYQVIEEPEKIYLVMQCVEGEDLLEYLKKGKNLNEKYCVHILTQILEALKYAHQKRICHRDIKLANILIDKDDKVKIIDFGLSKQYEIGKKLKTFCGSPCFAAPQLISQLPYNPAKADIWSVGIVFYALLSQTLPFYHYDLNKLYKLVQKGKYQIPNNFSKLTVDFLSHILKVNPSQRFTFEEALKHKLITQYKDLQVHGFDKFEQEAEKNRQLAQKTKYIQKILKFNINFTNKQIEQCLFNRVRKFNALNTNVCCLFKLSQQKLKTIYHELIRPSKKRGFLLSKPSLTINADDEFLQVQESTGIEKSKILSPMTNISSQDQQKNIPSKKQKLLKRSKSSKQMRLKLFSNNRKNMQSLNIEEKQPFFQQRSHFWNKKQDINLKKSTLSNEKSEQKQQNIRSVRLQYFGGQIKQQNLSTSKIIPPHIVCPELLPCNSLQFSKQINPLSSVKESDFHIQKYIKVNLSKQFQKTTSSPRLELRKSFDPGFKRSSLGLDSLRLSNSVTNTMLMSIGQQTPTCKKQRDGNNKNDDQKPKNKYIGPFNICHSLKLSYKKILKILRRAGFQNPQLTCHSQKPGTFNISQKTISNVNYGDIESQQIKTRQFNITYPVTTSDCQLLVTSSFEISEQKQPSQYSLKVLRLQGFPNRHLIRIQPFNNQLMQQVIQYIKNEAERQVM